jgi:hypothetical protein
VPASDALVGPPGRSALDNLVERFPLWRQHSGLPAEQRADQPSAAIGTVVRASTVDRLAAEAGFASTEMGRDGR